MASKMRKPDGLFLIEGHQLPEVLHELPLRDLHGIARGMETRLHAAGIHTVAQLCAAPKSVLHGVWGGVLGARLWHLLRGDEIPDMVSGRKSLGHSHVLPPDSRTPDIAWAILCKLLHKAGERLRAHGLLAGKLVVSLAYLGGGRWEGERQMEETDASLRLMRLLEKLWRERPEPRARLLQVGVVLTRLLERRLYTPPLFPEDTGTVAEQDPEKLRRLDEAIDRLRARYGRKVVYFGSVQDNREAAPMRISFTHIPDLELEGD
jgi:DNA polymerase-4